MAEPPDLLPRPPDFVGLGAMRSGTSWLYELLMQHPESYDAGPKERHFFDRFAAQPFTGAHVAEYHQMFARTEGTIAGEVTPRYMSDFWAPPLLRRAAPDARLFVVLRDPVERFASGRRLLRPANYALLRALGHFDDDDEEGRKAFDLPPEILATESMRRGRYHAQIRQIRRYFPSEQLLVLQFERAVDDPAANYRRLLRHIGYRDTDFLPDGLHEPVGATSAADGLDDHLRASLVDALRDDVQRLARDHPDDIDPSYWPNFSSR